MNKILVRGVPENSEQNCRQPKPTVHCGNMDNLCTPPLPEKEERDQVPTNNKLQFLDMKMGWYPEGDLQFGISGKRTAVKVCQKGKYPHT